MKKVVILLAIAFLVVFISGCQKTTNETTVITSDTETTEYIGGPMSCEDSDGGKDKGAAGTVTGIDIDGNSYELEDECVVTWLVEYFCDGDEYKNQNFICDDACKDGACI